MGLGFGKIISSIIGKNLDATHETQLMQVAIDEKTGDTQTIEELHIPGYQYKTSPNSEGFFSKVHEAWKILFSIDDKVTKKVLTPGERYLYSDAAGTVMSSIYFKIDGSILIETLSAVNVVGDVIAGAGITNISLLNHFHQGNLGFPTDAAIVTGGGTTPSSLPSTNASGDIIDGSSTNLSSHTHSQGVDSNSDTEQDTSGPL